VLERERRIASLPSPVHTRLEERLEPLSFIPGADREQFPGLAIFAQLFRVEIADVHAFESFFERARQELIFSDRLRCQATPGAFF
jgi:hypothetical protein